MKREIKIDTGYKLLRGLLVMASLGSCNSASDKETAQAKDSTMSCSSNMPSRFAASTDTSLAIVQGKISNNGMIYIKGGEFLMGASDDEGRQDEYPQHKVKVDGFWMDGFLGWIFGFR